MKHPFTLNEIEKTVLDHACKIEATVADLPTFGHSRDGACPHIEVDKYGYHFVVVERGNELERRITIVFDDLLYWIFEYVTFGLASRYERDHRVPAQDSRVILFERQVYLLSK